MQLSLISLALTKVYGGVAAFSPSSLFASGEQGAWYDPSDLSMMFQDSAGTTPVTADGQPVGLILDKSSGLVLGADIAPNTFNALNATITNGGTFPSTATATASTYGFVVSAITTAGKYYEYSMSWTGNINNRTLQVGDGSYGPTSTLQSGTITGRILTSGTQIYAYIFGATVGESFTVTDITCKLVSGNHATQATAASRPLKTSTGAAYWTNYDAVDDVLNTTFPSSLGSSCTVCRANVGAAPTILTAQTIGTSYADSTDNAGLIIINRALTGQETTDVTAWLTAKGAT